MPYPQANLLDPKDSAGTDVSGRHMDYRRNTVSPQDRRRVHQVVPVAVVKGDQDGTVWQSSSPFGRRNQVGKRYRAKVAAQHLNLSAEFPKMDGIAKRVLGSLDHAVIKHHQKPVPAQPAEQAVEAQMPGGSKRCMLYEIPRPHRVFKIAHLFKSRKANA